MGIVGALVLPADELKTTEDEGVARHIVMAEETSFPTDSDRNNYNFPTVDERSAEERAIDDWLPITFSRTAEWWYSAFHIVTAIVGAGVLGLPHAMAELGWGPGVVVLVTSWTVSLYTLWQMVNTHEFVPGKRFDRYHELGQYAFGKTLGLWIVLPQQLIVIVGVDIVYMITGGHSLQKFHELVCEHCKNDTRLTYFVMIFACIEFVLSQLPSFNSIAGMSLAAAVMSLSYSTIAWGASIHRGVQPNVEYGYKSNTAAGTVLDFFSALGSVMFAYGGQNVVMEIQATMPSTLEKPSKGPMLRGVIAAYMIVAVCYLPVALIGYRMFGNQVDENILITLQKPKWLIALANIFVAVHLIGSYQVYAMPVFGIMEFSLVKKLKLRPTWYIRFMARSTYVAFTMLIAISFPFFDGILGFVGVASSPTLYILPCLIWLAIHKPRRFTPSWLANWFCIIFAGLLMVVGGIGGLRKIIVKARDYKFYS